MVAALANGLRAIEAFTATHQRMSLSDVARHAGLSRAAARRYLLTLVACGYAEMSGKQFQLTPRVLRLGYAYVASVPLTRIAQPIIEELGEKTDEAVALAVLDGPESLIVASSVSRRIVGVFTRVGTHLPAATSSTGRVLLSDKSDEAILHRLQQSAPVAQLTAKTKISPTEILAEIRRVRDLGYALNDEEIELGLRVIAVPVKTATGITAALCISTFSGRFEINQLKAKFLDPLKRASEKLGQLI
jgi:IclR family pca regulon transcriptional regulator